MSIAPKTKWWTVELTRNAREAQAIRDSECRAQEKRAIVLVLEQIQTRVAKVDDLGNVVCLPRVVERASGRHGHVFRIPSVCIVENRSENPCR